MLEEKEKIISKNILLNLRRNKKETTAYEKAKVLWCIVAVFLSLLLIGLIYFLSDASNIYHIDVEGNKYLSTQNIIEESKLTKNSKYILTIPFVVENRIKDNPLVEDCKVTLNDKRLVQIEVVEKKIVGYILENGLYELVTGNNEKISLNNDNLYLIGSVPLIEGFNEEDLITLERHLDKCDYSIINQISEIHSYPDLKFQNVELVMADGNYIFTSVFGMEILNKYFDIESSYISDRKQCYYFEDISGNAYTSACPWEKVEEEVQPEDTEEETVVEE